MAIKTTTCYSGHCGCVVQYQWDSAVPVESRTHTQSRVIRQCAEHAGDVESEVFTVIHEEGGLKARIIERVEETHPAIAEALRDGGVTFTTTRVNGRRCVTVSLPTLTPAQRAQVQAWCDTRWPGRVTITG